MAQLQLTLQDIVFPWEEKFDSCHGLFYTSGETDLFEGTPRFVPRFLGDFQKVEVSQEGLHLDTVEHCLVVEAGTVLSLCTYLNSFSSAKWTQYTDVQNICLNLEAMGSFDLIVKGFSADEIPNLYAAPRCSVNQQVVDTLSFDNAQRRNTTVEFADVGQFTVMGVELHAKTECRVYGGRYCGELDGSLVNDVELALVSTTFKKEDYIASNIRLLEEEIFREDGDLADHFHVYIIDNGRTLDPHDFDNEHLTVFPNSNYGGSGGFARGMIEVMKSDARITNVLLMDDDVLILTESIKRLYALLRALKPEYRNSHISGAMLKLEHMEIQHEDIGYVKRRGYVASKKGTRNLLDPRDYISNEAQWPHLPHEYAAWWFCCIPMCDISPQTLPMPLFVRGDDVEFGLRSDAEIISMNGICVWHVGFGQKFSASTECYQVMRNFLIFQAASGSCDDVGFMEELKRLIRVYLCEFAYNQADLLLDAVEDYMKGPEFLLRADGAALIREKGARNEDLVPLDQLELGKKLDYEAEGFPLSVLVDEKFDLLMRCKRRLTANGHTSTSDRAFFREFGTTPYDWNSTPGRQRGTKVLIAVNPYAKTGIERHMDRERFQAIEKRRQSVFSEYDKNRRAVREAWRSAYPRLTSEEFWQEYLQLEQ